MVWSIGIFEIIEHEVPMSFAESFVTCNPKYINNGHFKPIKQAYMLNERIEAVCDSSYYLFGTAKRTCSSSGVGEVGVWLPAVCTMSEDCSTECLKPERYEERCEKTGKHAKISKEGMYCDESEGGLSTCYI